MLLRCESLAKILVLMIAVNVLLSVSYLSLFCSEWGQVAGLPLAGPVRWEIPFRTDIGFVGPLNGPLVNGLVMIYHWSFIPLLTMMILNLAAIGMVEHHYSSRIHKERNKD
jgi:hypothetical protein